MASTTGAAHNMNKEETEAIRQRLVELRLEHRDLDDVIQHLSEQLYVDQLQIRRLKKRKLLLRDMIQKMESMLIPDMPA